MISSDRLALTLDTPDLSEARALVKKLGKYYGVLKIGLTLWAAQGPKSVKVLKSQDHQIFLDLKLHDIPNQIGNAAEVISDLGVTYLTLHSDGGEEMLRHAVKGLAKNQVNPAKALAITVLTSHTDVNEEVFIERLKLAKKAGCYGIVCSALELPLAKKVLPDIFCAVPGIRLKGSDTHDQSRVATLQEAEALGADLLVIGRTVTENPDPIKATQELLGI